MEKQNLEPLRDIALMVVRWMSIGSSVRNQNYFLLINSLFLLAIQLDVISKAKGSCYIENGNTKIICAVFELREVPRVNKYA